MLQSHLLTLTIDLYACQCEKDHVQPSVKGLAECLEVSPCTLFNVIRGTYNNGVEYSNKPSHNRKINNKDFELVRELFKNG